MLLSRALLFALALTLLACGKEEGPPAPGVEDPHRALLPPSCRVERSGDCRACVATCCAPCHEGSDCIRYSACSRSCVGILECIADCAEEFPDGVHAWWQIEDCIDYDCADTC